MKPLSVINVAGLLMHERDDTLEAAMREGLQPNFIQTIAPTPASSFNEHPNHGIERAMFMIRAAINTIEEQHPDSRILLVGRSYGACIALLAAVRMDFEKIFKLILVEGPLHPDISVRPPALLPPLLTCGIHYDTRPELAREAVRYFERSGTSRVVIIQGMAEDAVVPSQAQVLPGDFDIVQLPHHLGGKDRGMKRLLPPAYRNHLFWSDAKMSSVVSSIRNAAHDPLATHAFETSHL